MGTLNLLHNARSIPPHTQVSPRFKALIICWCQDACLPTEHGGPVLPTFSDKRALAPPSKSKNARFPTEERKAITCYSAGSTRIPVLHTAPPCWRVTSVLSKSWISSNSTEWQSTTLMVLGGLPATVHRDPVLPTVTAGEPLHPYKRAGAPVPSLRG
jgi:hypothetical protein